MLKLWNFYWDASYGVIEGLFLAPEEEVAKAIGKEIKFGEILGKHSQVEGVLEWSDLTSYELSENTMQEMIMIFGDTWSGYNPLHYIS